MANKRPEKPRWAFKASKYGPIADLSSADEPVAAANPARKSAPDGTACSPAEQPSQGRIKDND